MEVQKELKHDVVSNLLSQGKRADGRQKLQYRDIVIKKDVLENAEGSALCSIGKTQVLAGIKLDVATPYADRADEGILSTGAEFTPLGAPHFEPGPPRAEAIELARVVDRAVRSSEAIDLKKNVITPGEKVLAIYIDLWVLDHGGNLFDAALLASMAALKGTRMPKIEDGKLNRKESSGMLEVSKDVVSCTFAKIGKDFLLDPSFSEEIGSDTMVILATAGEHLCSGQKSGKGEISQKELGELIDISFEKAKELRRAIA
ncbi:hypothetical protein COU37_04305 [Candidatus Micrarchaeota archaeon CG10_big_fil_rev_8_21_14_0_10_45_29]|nr:MAG: hypothetical protein COU37_04305 [Candidatus Micrarchaeota archaeon CG10_big_fil_rev_8_21_14_0_10_45_29]